VVYFRNAIFSVSTELLANLCENFKHEFAFAFAGGKNEKKNVMLSMQWPV
jgi:hypothetical protein